LRISYYGDYYEAHLDDGTLPINAGEEVTVDAELGYTFNDNLSLVAGAQNLFDNQPDTNPWGRLVVGSQYPATSPMGFNGGFWYLRGAYQF
jgi:iron complex outermembrane receptor protein